MQLRPITSRCGALVASPIASAHHRSRCPPCQSSSTNNARTDDGVDQFFQPGVEGASRQGLFNRISPVYDELNDELSFGLHRVWKRMTVKWSAATRGCTALDVCCGSGDLALALADVAGPSGRVVGLDFSASMLEDAALRQAEGARRWGERVAPVQWVQGDAMDLPFEDAYFDAATMGYGLRNVADIPKALQELLRVLKPGGRAAILDFNNSESPLVDSVQGLFLENLVVPAAEARGVGDEYRYLRPSIKRFPTGKEQERLALGAGFLSAVHYEIGFGLMGVLVATKDAP